MIFIYSVAANTQNTYIWLKLYHLWSSYVWDVSGKSKCNTFLFCWGCRWEFLFDEQLIFPRCCRIIALQGSLGVLQMWVLNVLQIHTPDSRQLSLSFFPPYILKKTEQILQKVLVEISWHLSQLQPNIYYLTGKKIRFLESLLCLFFLCEAKGWEQNGFFCTWCVCRVGDLGVQRLEPKYGKIPCTGTGSDCTWARVGADSSSSPSIYPTPFPLLLHLSGCKLLPLWILLLY